MFSRLRSEHSILQSDWKISRPLLKSLAADTELGCGLGRSPPEQLDSDVLFHA